MLPVLLLRAAIGGCRGCAACARRRQPGRPELRPPPRVTRPPRVRPNLQPRALGATPQLPAFVAACPVAQRYRSLLGALDWDTFPRTAHRTDPGPARRRRPAPPLSPPSLSSSTKGDRTWASCAPTWSNILPWSGCWASRSCPSDRSPWGFDVDASLPSRTHFGRVLRELDNDAVQFLLTASVKLIRARPAARPAGHLRRRHLPRHQAHPRLGQGEQPQGLRQRPLRQDPPAQRRPRLQTRLQAHGRTRAASGDAVAKDDRQRRTPACRCRHAAPPQPPTVPASQTCRVGEYYWGYASGVVATKVARLGRSRPRRTHPDLRPRRRQLLLPADDADRHGASAAARASAPSTKPTTPSTSTSTSTTPVALPLSPGPTRAARDSATSSPQTGLPLCAAGLAMPLKFTLPTARRPLRGPTNAASYGCPLVWPHDVQPDAVCPRQPCQLGPRGLHHHAPHQRRRTASATNWIATATTSRRSTASAPPPNASTARPWNLASSARICPPVGDHQSQHADLCAHQPAHLAAHPPAQGGSGAPVHHTHLTQRLTPAANAR